MIFDKVQIVESPKRERAQGVWKTAMRHAGVQVNFNFFIALEHRQ